MKTFFNSILLSLVCLVFYSLTPISAQNTKSLLIQATDINVSSDILTQSAKVMNNRLISYGMKSNVLVIYDKAQIVIELPNNINKSEFTQLLTSKGDLGFYETLTLSEMKESLKNENQKSLNDFQLNSSDSGIGCATSKDPKMLETIQNYLKQNNLSRNTKILWSQFNSNSQTCLYVLKTNNVGSPPLVRSDIETISSSKDNNSQSFNIQVKFTPEAAKIWADLTKKNLNKPIAIVIDDKVYYTPVVKTAMESGLCEITGNLSVKEANLFLALVNNGTLPTDFTIK
jgi:SecD/SecF fusion protein